MWGVMDVDVLTILEHANLLRFELCDGAADPPSGNGTNMVQSFVLSKTPGGLLA